MAETPTTPTGSGTPSSEPRALSAALAGPVFQTKNSGTAMHAATRHVERWAPEAGADRVRSLRNLGFVDRLVAPWLEVAQRSASMRLFQQYRSEGMAERQTPNHVSWVFPRPWYQDELDWMAASREVAAQAAMQRQSAPTMFTTRGTYVAPAQRQQIALPAALYEHVAPSLSIAPPMRGDLMASTQAPPARVHDAYSPLVPFAAVNAAQLMQRAVAPLIGTGDGVSTRTSMMSPGLRSVLSTMLERSVVQRAMPATEPTRSAAYAPELVTPPAPRLDELPGAAMQAQTSQASHATHVAEDVSTQRSQIVELQRAARIVAEREHAQRTAVHQAQVAATQTEAQQQHVQAQTTVVERQRAAEVAAAQTATGERTRVEERVAARMAERQAAVAAVEVQQQQRGREQRLHEAAREAAARDAQVAPASATYAETATAQPARRVVPQEITNALANLSPALATTIAANLAQHPERAVQTIGELGEALRNAELIARTAATGRSFVETRGPRLVMPAGLGGLVATVDRNVAQTEHVAARPMTQMQAPLPMIAPRPMMIPTAATSAPTSAMRMPAMAWLAAPNSPAAQQAQLAAFGASPTALAATESASPAALQHVAWADRWLARFSGARPSSLDLLTAASALPETRFQALANAAPGTVFVAPQHDESVDDSPAAVAARAAAAPTFAPPVRRYDDNEATPDSEFVAISQMAARSRTPVSSVPELVIGERDSLADAVAHTVPVAPNAGLSAQLASSPFAPAFRHMFPVAAAHVFDVRALFGETLSAAYLAGVLAPAARQTSVGAAIGQLPGFETIAATTPFAPINVEQRAPIEWAPEYVAAMEPNDPTSVTAASETAPVAAQQTEQLTTMRSALLSWNIESIVTPQATSPMLAHAMHELRVDAPTMTAINPVQGTPATFGGQSAMSQAMVEAMSLPMIEAGPAGSAGYEFVGGEPQRVPTFGAPGMIADRAQSWSVAQERSAADLSFDFVTPELVLAARVYGLGPAEAAQAMRLAIAGPGQLAAMASTVNRTFVQALAIEAERRDYQAAQQLGSPSALLAAATPITAYPMTTPITGTAASFATPTAPFMLPPVTTTFGVDRRTPRGAFMWPAATIAALGLSAAAPDGEHGMPVAALELLAAQSVAALGTYAALGFGQSAFSAPDDAVPTTLATAASVAPAMTLPPLAEPTFAEPSETDVLTSASALVATSRRAKFEAMYVALGQSPQARSWSPAARAARALALAGRGDESVTASERAQIAWSVLPLVAPSFGAFGFAGGAEEQPGAVQSTSAQVQRSAQRRQVEIAAEQLYAVESRPGLSSLSSRAGEALGSYVAPSGYESSRSGSSSSPSSREHGAVLRAPSAAPDYVRTGSVGGVRSTGRFGGGEVEVPTWFESAARKMLEDRSPGLGGDMSLAELTLVNSAPSTHIAASERSAQSSAPSNPNPSTQSALQTAKQMIDIEKVANEVYRHILVLMDGARARNGEPYL